MCGCGHVDGCMWVAVGGCMGLFVLVKGHEVLFL